MTNFQKAFCVFLSLCFTVVLAFLPEPFFLRGNVYRQIPLYDFLEKEAWSDSVEIDKETEECLIEKNAQYLTGKVKEENKSRITNTPVPSPTEAPAPTVTPAPEIKETAAQPHPVIDLSPEALADYDYLRNQFFIQDENAGLEPGDLDAARFLKKDMRMKQDNSKPQILIYHSHSQEAFADSREGETEDTVVGVGNYLTKLLTEKYGYRVLHVTEPFDMASGVEDRSAAYDYAREYLESFLEKNPSVEVLIDLHRDGIAENRHLVTEINGKKTAQIMFFNGLSNTVSKGPLSYLPNPYIEDNLAFSFQLEYQAAQYYPEFYRGIYLAGFRYNLHLRPKSILLEAGAQTNTVEEVKNAMEPFADILDRVLKGK